MVKLPRLNHNTLREPSHQPIGAMKIVKGYAIVTLNRPVISSCKTIQKAGGIELEEGILTLNGA